MEITNLLGKFVLSYRKKRKMSQELLAEKAGISRATLIKLETAGSNLSIENINKLFFVLNVNFNDFHRFLSSENPLSMISRAKVSDEDKFFLRSLLEENEQA